MTFCFEYLKRSRTPTKCKGHNIGWISINSLGSQERRPSNQVIQTHIWSHRINQHEIKSNETTVFPPLMYSVYYKFIFELTLVLHLRVTLKISHKQQANTLINYNPSLKPIHDPLRFRVVH